ncbi:MAG: hypothetical protein QQW96_20370 [Tychonema bourrellyi B0820]|nr:hypothetical protein [Tychonema bourrellyi B0820]
MRISNQSLLGMGHWALGIGNLLSVSCYWLWVIGNLLSVTGYWLLFSCYWLLI